MNKPVKSARSFEEDSVLSKALIRAANLLGINQITLSHILGLSPASVSRLIAGHTLPRTQHKAWELACLLIRLYRSLVAIVGPEQAKIWLGGHNHSLNARPIDLIQHTEGLVRVVWYLDSYRGR